jgi:hypothetical protein
MIEILQALRLRTHPFRPLEDAAGQPFNDPDLLLKPLDPLQDARLKYFYFDHYLWQGSIRNISPNTAFVTFPTKAEMVNQGPLMVLISGSDNTGRESLRNLILHRIGTDFGPPVPIQATLAGLNHAQNIRSIAEIFLFTYNQYEPAPALAVLQPPFDGQTGQANVGAANNYSTLFQIWRNSVALSSKRPLVLLLDGTESHDLWRAVYDSTSHLFRFIIVMTKNEAHANACYTGLGGKNRVLIKAKPLGPQHAEEYLAARLASERVDPPGSQQPLMPFSQNALEVLYEPGATFKKDDKVEWPIGWLNETFSAVMDDHLATLNTRLKELRQLGHDVSDINPNELMIDAALVRAVRKRLYQS